MAVFAIGDLHLSLGTDKPMDCFEGWQDYVPRLEANWRRQVQPEDTVVLAGDTSWAMKLEHCTQDFAFLHALPGRKLLLKGNHDYWWATAGKMEQFLTKSGFSSLHILHNNCYFDNGMALCGTRGWMFDPGQPHDAKIINREAGRLAASLQAAEREHPGAEKLVFLHYPPLYQHSEVPEMLAVMKEHGVRRCFYGHLHGSSIRWAVQGEQDGMAYRLISADALGFSPLKIKPF